MEILHSVQEVVSKTWDNKWRLRGYVPFTNWNLVWHNIDRKATSILDIGCGTGRPMRFLNRDGHHFTVGLDAFKHCAKQCLETHSHTSHVLGDARALPFHEKSFDIVMCLQVFEHLDREEGIQLLQQMKSIARRQIMMTTDVGEYVQHQSADGNTYQEHKCVWSVSELKQLGFHVHGMGLAGWGGETGLSHHFPKAMQWPIGTLLQLALGPAMYAFPRYSGSVICTKDLTNHNHN